MRITLNCQHAAGIAGRLFRVAVWLLFMAQAPDAWHAGGWLAVGFLIVCAALISSLGDFI